MRIAIVHDYFTQMGGAEKVAEELFRMFPEADVFATVALTDKLPPLLQGVPVQTSWMRFLPRLDRYYRFYFPLYPFAVQSLNLQLYDLVLSSSSGYAKGVTVRPDAIHVCYCHTPMRWVWSYDNYSSRESFGKLLRSALPPLVRLLRRWDENAAQQPDHYVANSRTVASRIKRFYHRSAEVIAPPIDVNRFHSSVECDDYYVVLARLVPYKRIDLAVEAFSRLNRRLIIIGDGPAAAGLRASAGPSVVFTGRISDYHVEQYVSRSRGLIFPGEEDFGIAPLEVAAAGRPTVAFRAGGATETIIEDVTGVFFDEQTVESLMGAVQRCEELEWDLATIQAHANGYSSKVFQNSFMHFLHKVGFTDLG